MCFTVSVEKKVKEAIKEYLKSNEGVQMKFNFDEDYFLVSGFSHPKLPIIKQGVIELANMTLNARSDTIREKPSYKKSIVSQRCLLVVDGFFEWRHENNRKIPFYIYPKDETVFYMGCIYNSWVNKLTGEVRDTFSIITTAANPLMEYIHNSKKRMPLILSKDDIATWIDPSTPQHIVDSLMKPFPESTMRAHQIPSDAGNQRKNRNVPEIKKEV
jgi:putative SOS response-associated peptidase YedK